MGKDGPSRGLAVNEAESAEIEETGEIEENDEQDTPEDELLSINLAAEGEPVVLTLEIPETARGERMDKILAALDPSRSRAEWQRVVKEGRLTRDGVVTLDPGVKLRGGERVAATLIPPRHSLVVPQAIPLVVVFEDESLIVIDKPAGLTVHPGAGAPDGTLVNALLHHCAGGLSGIGGVERPGIVHRLDKETSGLIVAAKSDVAHRKLAEQFQDHSAFRTYWAVARGVFNASSGTVDAPIGRHETARTRMAVVPHGGRRSVTHWRVVERFSGVALLACRLETGRTHQIRVHMAHIAHALLGDPVYGKPFHPPGRWPAEVRRVVEEFPRQALHAAKLTFVHPLSGRTMRFSAPLPEDLAGLIEALRSLG
ncbi:MAG: RluA family pseudouridine synthase [Magnetococcales bacterium]|nr:RluA family pseudouridine synthase [Magnetococcales bacterium]